MKAVDNVNRASVAGGVAVVWIVYRVLFLIPLSLVLAGCAPAKQVVRTETVEVPKYIRTPIPAELVQPTVVVEPAPLCGSTFCNGQIATMLGDYRAGLNQCNADKSALRNLNAEPL